MEMYSFIQKLGLLPLVSNVSKIGNLKGIPLIIDQDIDHNVVLFGILEYCLCLII